MATSRRPSYLKRQKEQARIARANEKRQARMERKNKGGGAEMGTLEDLGIGEPADPPFGIDSDEDSDTDEA